MSELLNVWHLSTSTNYVNGGICVSLSEKSRGVDLGLCPWYSSLLKEGWEKVYTFRHQLMDRDFGFWLLECPESGKVAMVAYRDGSPYKLDNYKVVCGKIVSKEEAHEILGKFSPFS